jgi:hypothetical protein
MCNVKKGVSQNAIISGLSWVCGQIDCAPINRGILRIETIHSTYLIKKKIMEYRDIFFPFYFLSSFF